MDTDKTLWKIDPQNTEIKFKAKNMLIIPVTGHFHSFNGTLETVGDDLENAAATFTADTDSISTNNEDRDKHLKKDDFFNAEKYPHLKFISTIIKKTGNQQYKVTGKITIRDITKEIELDVKQADAATGLKDNTKATFQITGSLNRQDFDLLWGNNFAASNEIKLRLSVEATKQ